MSLKRMLVSVKPLEPDPPLGRVTAVHGSVVDIAFAGGILPAITDPEEPRAHARTNG